MTAVISELPRVRRALLAWHRRHGLRAPWRESGDPYQALVAAVMAQQTQMSRVLDCYGRFIATFPSVEALAAASTGDVIRAWAGMGYNQRAVRLHRAARHIAASGWPRTAAELARMDGVGPFTAAIVASFGFGEPAAGVDTNVRRLLCRLAGDETLGPRDVQSLADAAISTRAPARWNQALMDYGASVCTPRPRCDECAVSRWCAWRSARAGTDVRLVADGRAECDVSRTRSPRYEGSDRCYRGRIVDVLRSLPPGEAVNTRSLPRLIAHGRQPPHATDVRSWVTALADAGLVIVEHGRVRLPD